jgi:hypothetical protein
MAVAVLIGPGIGAIGNIDTEPDGPAVIDEVSDPEAAAAGVAVIYAIVIFTDAARAREVRAQAEIGETLEPEDQLAVALAQHGLAAGIYAACENTKGQDGYYKEMNVLHYG